jgi:hypothetical protein
MRKLNVELEASTNEAKGTYAPITTRHTAFLPRIREVDSKPLGFNFFFSGDRRLSCSASC